MTLQNAINTYAHRFHTNDDLDKIITAIGDATYVLLGEASHGTSEFYTVRAALTKRLITEKGFTIIAVEGDFPPSQHINRYIKEYDDPKTPKEVVQAFHRWPTWMWAN